MEEKNNIYSLITFKHSVHFGNEKIILNTIFYASTDPYGSEELCY